MAGMLTRICFALAIGFVAHSSQAQVIYEPVQYQYGDQNKFYYGGTDQRVFERAAGPADAGAQWGRVDGYDFASGDLWTHREVSDQPARVYSDALPTQNATLYGFTAADAANVANAAVPRYFRKADVEAAARQAPGTLIVPARAESPEASTPASVNVTRQLSPTTQPLMILPAPTAARGNKPNRATPSDKQLVAAH
jgi:hypothetical protein